LTLRMCVNMGMHIIHGKVALRIQFRGPQPMREIRENMFEF